MDKSNQVAVTMSVEDWADVVAAIGTSPIELMVKSRLNEKIYNCIERAL